jgi:phosphatidylinositol alpha-1,6-mannosyltransferase
LGGIPAGREHGVVTADHPRAFAQALTELLADPAQAAGLGAAGRAMVEQRFTWEASAERLERLLMRARAVAERKEAADAAA